MKKILQLLVMLGICLLGLYLGSGFTANAEENEVFNLYKSGVDAHIINDEKYDYNTWDKKVFLLLKESYNQIQQYSEDNISLEDWVKANNYGIIPQTNDSIIDGKENSNMLRSTASNKKKFINVIKPGDIIFSAKYTLSGFIGHAALATTHKWIVEMPGGKTNPNGLKDNNRQITTANFFETHKSNWNYVYRLPNQSLAKKVATYADKHFYSTKGTSKKDVHISYGIDSHMKRKNPNYCSKLVYQAYYYGSGDLPVMKPYPNIFAPIPPAQIINTFRDSYLPYCIGKY
ncbi:hypothetical protein [Listeria grayi]|uniref:hypothetical protein n=1 Tax=Listeria grayi TaxID=1641 RepID=UPI00162A2283|nr:hypothetical protein [Listeria grayi]MBC1923016.1 hypothetical protein [Listeria grayi]